MIVIIGAGVAGLSLGWELVRAGAPVTILEAGEIGSGASHAAAAYLEPRLGGGKLRALEQASISAWPDYVQTLEEDTGHNVDYRREGMVRIAYPETLEKSRSEFDQRMREGQQAEWIEGAALRELEPALSDEVKAGIYMPGVHWVDGRKLCAALAMALENGGGKIFSHTPVTGFSAKSGNAIDVQTPDQKLTAEKLVIACGMGSNNLSGAPGDIPKGRPVKGVMLGLAMDPEKPLVHRLIKRPDGILCPRSDGRLLVGVTHEEGETSTIASVEAVHKLMASAMRAVPEIGQLKFLEAACGIRTLVGDGLLRLGRSGEMDNVYYSLSHAGAGFIRAPQIAKEFSEFIRSDNAECPFISPFLKR